MTDIERILTLHPEGKQGVRIERAKYDDMVRALLGVIPGDEPGVRFTELEELVTPHLSEEQYPGGKSVAWYLTTIKLTKLYSNGHVDSRKA